MHINQLAAFDTSNAVNALPETTRNQQQSHITEALANGHAILVLASYRQLLGFDATQESRDLLLKQSREKRRQIALFLIHQASETKDPIPGDPQLGFLVLDLLSDSKQKSQPIDQQLERLPLLLKASGIADNYQQFDGVLQELTAKPLNDTQLQAITAILQQRGAMKVNVPKSSPSEKSFWASVLKRSKSGEDQWLEASLQLASIAVQERNFKDAAKMLNVIDALHPEWGTPERKTRAAALKAEVESTR